MRGKDKKDDVRAIKAEANADYNLNRKPMEVGNKHSHPGKITDHAPSSMKKMRFT